MRWTIVLSAAIFDPLLEMPAISCDLWLTTLEMMRTNKKQYHVAKQPVIKKSIYLCLIIVLTSRFEAKDLSKIKIVETKRWRIKQNLISNGKFPAPVFRFWFLAQQPKNINNF